MDAHIPCPLCRHDNPSENRFCGHCGAPLAGSEQLALRQANSPNIVDRSLPARFGPVGKALALGLAALAAETGLAWLRRRNERFNQPSPLNDRSAELAVPEDFFSQSLEEVFVQLQEGGSRDRIFARRVVRFSNIARPADRSSR
jgi:hypothetical protein